MPLKASSLYMDVSFDLPMQRVDLLIHGSKTFGIKYVAPDAYLSSVWAGSINVKNANEFAKFICLDASAQNYSCRFSGGYIQIKIQTEKEDVTQIQKMERWRVDPCTGNLQTVDIDLTDSLLSLSDSLRCPVTLPVLKTAARNLNVKVSGLTKTTAKRLGLKWSDVLASFDDNGIRSLWAASVVASDSFASLDFARSVSFAVADSGSLNFGSESRRANTVMDLENGKSVTSFESVFDGLTVNIYRDAYQLQYRQGSSVLIVPSIIGSCSIGIADLNYKAKTGLPLLQGLPFIGKLFRIDNEQRDEMAITVCVNE